MKAHLIKLFLLIITPVFASPYHLVNSTHWDNSVWTEYGQSFEATAPSMRGVSFYMRNNNGAPGPFEIAVYALPDTDTPIKLHEFSADGSGIDGLVEVAFDSYVSTTVGSNYLFTIKRSTTDTYDIGLYSMSDSYPQGETAVRLGDGTMAFNSSRDLSFAINSSWDSDGDGLSDAFEVNTYGTDPNDADSDDDGLSDYDELQSTYDWISMPTSKDASESWENARLDALSRGGHMACINSSNEWDIVHGVIMSNWPFAQIPANEFDALVIWLGGKYNALEGEWEWTNGEQWDVEFWTAQTPPNEGYLRIGWNALSEYESKNNWTFDSGSLSGLSHQSNAYYVLEKMIANTDPNDADSDDDGLNDGDEVNTYGTDPNDADSDDDGFSDSLEVSMNPTVDDSNLWAEIMDADTIKDIRAGSTIIGIDGQSGSGTITMILEETDNLSSSNWTAFGEAINVNITPSNNVRFYRFKMND